MSSSGSDDKRPSRVLDHLYIGSRVHAKNRGLLKELGINRVLNVTPARTMDPTNGVPNFFEKDRAMTYKRVAVFDNRGEDLLQHLESCISFIEQGSFYGKVLVHCNKGVSRSSTVVAAYLMRTRGLSKTTALTYLRSRRSIVNPHEGFLAQLDTFEAKLTAEREMAIADGQAIKFPDDLLSTGGRTAANGPAIGPIGPARGPSAPVPSPRNAPRTTSPARAPVVGPCLPQSTPTGSKSGAASGGARAGPIGPSRGPAPRSPAQTEEPPANAAAKKAVATNDGAEVREPNVAGGLSSGAGQLGEGMSSADISLASPDRPTAGDESTGGASKRGGGNRGEAEPNGIDEIGPKIGPPVSMAATSCGGDDPNAVHVGSKRAREGDLPIDVADKAFRDYE
ncbi:conserved unknown protein [Ectocarpus siliculosus]|uniref:protein-tyrosine-phosphatase n=1 Tax=Ectocarpus siliculosus TaxID=2880 RepID=D7G0E2_ECTSI|nr:conserved unknown protein [Ectocarpus siliculosus]|eukprot:CBJ26669.1 conserved unknown protein [Ectocarpus siliculosus]